MPRFTIDIDDRFNDTLSNLVKESSATSKAEVIRNAVAVYSYLKSNTAAQDGSQVVTVATKNGDSEQVLIP